jgi:hypothetical protein
MKKVMLIGVLVATCGCVDRELVITTDPPGASVTISEMDAGTTPLRKSFTWYGVYEIIIAKEGFETLKVAQNVQAPAHQIPPLDLLAELWPGTIYDRHEFHYTLKPRQAPTREELIRKADALRVKNDQKVAKPHPVMADQEK